MASRTEFKPWDNERLAKCASKYNIATDGDNIKVSMVWNCPQTNTLSKLSNGVEGGQNIRLLGKWCRELRPPNVQRGLNGSTEGFLPLLSLLKRPLLFEFCVLRSVV